MKCQNQTLYLLLLNMNIDWIETWLKSKYIGIIINISNEMPKSSIKFIPIQNRFTIVHVCFVLLIVCLYICVCECLLQNNNHKKKHETKTNCGSAFEPGASGLPYYFTSVCVRSCCNWRTSSVDFKSIYTYIYIYIYIYINKKKPLCCFVLFNLFLGIVTFPVFPRVHKPRIIIRGLPDPTLHLNYVAGWVSIFCG